MRKRWMILLTGLALTAAGSLSAADPDGACTIDAKEPCASPASPALSALGLMPGDILVSVNGRKLAKPADAKTAFEKLSASKVKVVEVLRDGRRQKIDLTKKK